MSRAKRAVIFGRDADLYDAVRPDYPIEAIEHTLGLTEVRTAVEVGAGTGKATKGFARKGLGIVCLEPDPAMAGVLAGRSLPGVEVVVERFEDWPGPREDVDLIYAAQAWHWLERGTAATRAMGWLRPGGAIALIWNKPEDRYERFEAVYREHAPEILEEPDERITRRDSNTWLVELEEAGFERVDLFAHPWSRKLAATEVTKLYSTYSDHIMLPADRRRRLLAGIESMIEAEGGVFEMVYRTEVYSGLKGEG